MQGNKNNAITKIKLYSAFETAVRGHVLVDLFFLSQNIYSCDLKRRKEKKKCFKNSNYLASKWLFYAWNHFSQTHQLRKNNLSC